MVAREPLPHNLQLGAASTTLLLAWSSHTIWWFYKDAQTFPTYELARDKYVDFFRYDERAHLNNIVVHLWSLFDKRKGTVSLSRLVEGAALNTSERAALNATLSGLKHSVRKLGVLRHEIIAHRTDASTYNEVFRVADIRYDEIAAILRGAREVLSRLRAAAGVDEWQPNDGTLEDVQAMLKVLGADA